MSDHFEKTKRLCQTDKTILIVSPFFAPENSIASVRFTKIGKYLAKRGYQVKVICGDMFPEIIEDKTLKKDMNWVDEIIRIRYPELYYLPLRRNFNTAGTDIRTGENKKSFLAKVTGLLYNEWTRSLWVYIWDCILAIVYIKKLHEKKWDYFDVVITTYSPLLSHYVGNYYKNKKRCIVWIADYRDPYLTFNKTEAVPQFLFKKNIRLARKADYITTVSEGTKEQIIRESGKYCQEIRNKMAVIYNGFDIEDREDLNIQRNIVGKLQIVYCGMFIQMGTDLKNSPELLFRALADLIREGRLEKDKIKFTYAGASFPVVKKYAEKYDLLDIVDDHGFISRRNALQLQGGADILLVCAWNTRTRRGILTGKFYETLLLERPVLGLVKGDVPNSELKKLIVQCNVGFCCEEACKSDYVKLKQWLLQKYREKLQTGVVHYECTEETLKFRYDVLTSEMEKLWKNKDAFEW